MGLAQALAAVRTAVDTVANVTVPTPLPSKVSTYPSALVYPAAGTYHAGMDSGKSLHDIVCDLVTTRVATPEAIDAATAYPDAVAAAFMADPTVGNTVAGIVFPVRYAVMNIPYGGEEHFGIRFTITVKCH
jgi:hypothetical protein